MSAIASEMSFSERESTGLQLRHFERLNLNTSIEFELFGKTMERLIDLTQDLPRVEMMVILMRPKIWSEDGAVFVTEVARASSMLRELDWSKN